MLIIIIGLLAYNYYYLYFIGLHSSPVELENLSLKVQLKGNSIEYPQLNTQFIP